MRKSYLFLIALVSLVLLQSCQKDPVDQGKIPELPPKQTLLMPFENFEDLDTLKGSGSAAVTRSPETFQNWFHAGVNVAIWNTVIVAGTAIPTAAYGEAFNHDPVHVGGGVYEWSYQSQNAAETYNIRLTGQFINNYSEVEWTMYAAKVNGFSEIVWFSGIVSTDFQSASWTLNHKPFNPEPALGIEYTYNPTAEEFEIRYTNIIPNNPDNGQYIEFRTQPNEPFNRAYDVFFGTQQNTLQIQWNDPTKEGRVKHPQHFGDDEWHCWDSEGKDTSC